MIDTKAIEKHIEGILYALGDNPTRWELIIHSEVWSCHITKWP